MRFRLLGDVEMLIDGRPVDAGHARQRSVLAVLLFDANRPVPAASLVDRVWADRPPQRARETLSGYLSRLRRVLAATDDARITRRSGGYVLTVDPTAVDLVPADKYVRAGQRMIWPAGTILVCRVSVS